MVEMEVATSFCASGGCVACGGCGARTVSSELELLAQSRPDLVTMTPDASISTETPLAVIGLQHATIWTGGSIGTPVVLTFAFGDENTLTSSTSLGTQGDHHELNEYQKAAWRAAMEMHSAASGVQLIEVSNAATANIVLNYQTMSNYTGLGWVSWPSQNLQSRIEINARYFDQIESMDFRPGQSDLLVFMLHEIGHSLGMKHPYVGDVQLDNIFNHRGYTVMSHTANPDGTYRADLSPLDRAALEMAYGTQADQDALPVQWYQLSGGGLLSVGNNLDNEIRGIRDRDLIIAGSGSDTINSLSGNDTIDAGAGRNIVSAGSGHDLLRLSGVNSFDNNFILGFTNSSTASSDGRSGFFISGESTVFFSGVDAFLFDDTLMVSSEVGRLTNTSSLDTAVRLFEIARGSPPPQSWVAARLESANKDSLNLEELARGLVSHTSWQTLLTGGLSQENFATLWGRAFGSLPTALELDLARNIGTGARLLIELTLANSPAEFMRAGFLTEFRAATPAAPEPGIAPIESNSFRETLEIGEATYGFRIVSDSTVRSQRNYDQISSVFSNNVVREVRLDDGRLIDIPAVQRVEFLDGVLDFRSVNPETFLKRVFEFLTDREMSPEEESRIFGSLDGLHVSRAVAALAAETAVSARIGGLSSSQFIESIYRALLAREPTAAEAQNLAIEIASGQTRARTLEEFILREDVVNRLYVDSESGFFFEDWADAFTIRTFDTIFNRPIMSVTRDNHSRLLENGSSLREFVTFMLNTTEASARYGRYSDQQFVEIIFQNTFGRRISQQESEYYRELIQSVGGSRASAAEAMVRAALDARESEVVTLSPTVFVDRLIGTNSADYIKGRIWNETIDGGSGNDTLDGGPGTDIVFGGIGTDSISGGTGADSLIGGAGNDCYLVDDAVDRVLEFANAGLDVVVASVSWTLPANVENLTLQGGSANLNGTGNGLANLIIGNAGANTLAGGGGADTLLGGLGNDRLLGGPGDDSMAGGAGGDTMIGQTGNDTYLVDSPLDMVREMEIPGEIDSVIASISWTLGANLERLTLTGSANLSGAGNKLDNVITGNAGANVLRGWGGADTLAGGDGSDILAGDDGADMLTGGRGNDVFVFDRNGAPGDVVMDFEGANAVGGDILRFAGFGTSGTVTLIGGNTWEVRGSAGTAQITLVDVTVLGMGDFVLS